MRGFGATLPHVRLCFVPLLLLSRLRRQIRSPPSLERPVWSAQEALRRLETNIASEGDLSTLRLDEGTATPRNGDPSVAEGRATTTTPTSAGVEMRHLSYYDD